MTANSSRTIVFKFLKHFWNDRSKMLFLKYMARPSEFERDVVLEKAMALFWQKGYANTSAQDLSEATGLSRSSLYNSFSDKRTLFLDCLHCYVTCQSKGLIAFLTAMPPCAESIRRLLDHVVEDALSGSHPAGCLVVNSAAEFGQTDSEIAGIIAANVMSVIAEFTTFIDRGQQVGRIASHLPAEQLATALFHQTTAIRLSSKVMREPAFHSRSILAFMLLFSTDTSIGIWHKKEQ